MLVDFWGRPTNVFNSLGSNSRSSHHSMYSIRPRPVVSWYSQTPAIPGRSLSGPSVSSHFQYVSMVFPMSMFPPGRRRNFCTKREVSIGSDPHEFINKTYRIQLLECFHQVDSQSILSVLVRGGKEADQVEVEGCRSVLQSLVHI